MRRLVLAAAALALSIACASTGRAPTAKRPDPTAPPRAAAGLGHRVVADALALRGVPYRNGGTDPAGFDCSGLVAYVFDRHGLHLPRQTRDQFTIGRAVERTAIQAGDLVFFSTVANGASHVGIAIDADEFVHAPSSNGVVRVERLALPYWHRRFIGARRVR